MTYQNTFIEAAADCPAENGEAPMMRGARKSLHLIQFELLNERPYHWLYDDLLFETHVRHKEISPEILQERGVQIREEFFARSHPCLRASPLTKRYGWGAHYDEEGRIALYGRGTAEYEAFLAREDIDQLKAMRNKRVK